MLKRRFKLIISAIILVAGIVLGIHFFLPTEEALAAPPCSAPYAIDVTLTNGGRWEMCWETRSKEGVVLRQVYFTPPGGTRWKILWQASLASAFVPYDDGSPRFYDLTFYGLGGSRLNNLTAAECPNGTRIYDGSKYILCQQTLARGFASKNYSYQRQGEMLNLYSVSNVGNYHYIVSWAFYDDGVIVPTVQATGTLYGDVGGATYGWPIGVGNSDYRTNHVHNHYWRLDFDLNGASYDRVEQIQFNNSGSTLRPRQTTTLSTESRRTVNATAYRFWRVRETNTSNSDGHKISYEIQPQASHVFRSNYNRGSAEERWSLYDFHVTRYRYCEQLVANNPTTGGCASNLYNYVNGENVSDVVVWVGASYHHVPRDEDQTRIQADHRIGVELVPRDWVANSIP